MACIWSTKIPILETHVAPPAYTKYTYIVKPRKFNLRNLIRVRYCSWSHVCHEWPCCPTKLKFADEKWVFTTSTYMSEFKAKVVRYAIKIAIVKLLEIPAVQIKLFTRAQPGWVTTYKREMERKQKLQYLCYLWWNMVGHYFWGIHLTVRLQSFWNHWCIRETIHYSTLYM